VNRGRLAWGVALLALLPHLVGLRGGFVYDDFRFFAENPGVQTLARPVELVADVARASVPPDHDIWRPLRTLLFAVEHALFGASAAGWHAVSLLLHLLLVRGVIALAERLPGMAGGRALAAGLLFGLHPLTVESVAWVSSQGDLLAALGVVVCLAFGGERPLVAGVAALLALLAKESALPLVAALLVARRSFVEGARPRGPLIVAVALVTVAYLLARQHVLARGFDLTGGGLGQRDSGIAAKLLQGCQNVRLTLQRFVWPWPLSVDYDHRLVGEPGARDVAVALLALGGIGGALARFRGFRERAGAPLLLALLFWLPTSGLAVALKSPTAERFLLLPCAMLALAVVAAPPVAAAVTAPSPSLAPARSRRRLALPAVVAAALALGSVAFARTLDFRSDEELWRRELEFHPASLQARLGLLNAASERGDRAAERELAESIVAGAPPGDARRITALFELGRLDVESSDEAESARGAACLEQCRREILARGRVDDLSPSLHLAWVALANWRGSRFGAADAESVAREGLGRFGRRARLLEALGVARERQLDAAGAEALYREALALEESASLRHRRARALIQLGRKAEAWRELEISQELHGDAESFLLMQQLKEELGQ
jgi:hypothetical protein